MRLAASKQPLSGHAKFKQQQHKFGRGGQRDGVSRVPKPLLFGEVNEERSNHHWGFFTCRLKESFILKMMMILFCSSWTAACEKECCPLHPILLSPPPPTHRSGSGQSESTTTCKSTSTREKNSLSPSCSLDLECSWQKRRRASGDQSTDQAKPQDEEDVDDSRPTRSKDADGQGRQQQVTSQSKCLSPAFACCTSRTPARLHCACVGG